MVEMDFPEVMTEEELIQYLRVPEISKSNNPHNVITNLKQMHNLPRLPLCGKVVYPREAVNEWIKKNTKWN